MGVIVLDVHACMHAHIQTNTQIEIHTPFQGWELLSMPELASCQYAQAWGEGPLFPCAVLDPDNKSWAKCESLFQLDISVGRAFMVMAIGSES